MASHEFGGPYFWRRGSSGVQVVQVESGNFRVSVAPEAFVFPVGSVHVRSGLSALQHGEIGQLGQADVHVFIFLLAKPSGGFRTIGLLPDMYRIWAEIRMSLVRDWHVRAPRDYFAAGPGKSTEDAAGRVLMAAEQMDSSQEAACFILDIDKCYENVSHSRIQPAAIRHGFPLTVARACIAMYRSQRTVAWDGVYGSMVKTGQTLAAGC